MAIWKRLTGVDGKPIDANMDQVCFIRERGGRTTLHFAGRMCPVKEKMEDIHIATGILSLGATEELKLDK